jgi:selenophosphate synthase
VHIMLPFVDKPFCITITSAANAEEDIFGMYRAIHIRNNEAIFSSLFIVLSNGFMIPFLSVQHDIFHEMALHKIL